MNNKTKQKIEDVIKKVQPYIQMHGGDVEIVSIEDDTITLNISGSCAHCQLADLTYNKMVGDLLKEEVPSIKNIIINKNENTHV